MEEGAIGQLLAVRFAVAWPLSTLARARGPRVTSVTLIESAHGKELSGVYTYTHTHTHERNTYACSQRTQHAERERESLALTASNYMWRFRSSAKVAAQPDRASYGTTPLSLSPSRAVRVFLGGCSALAILCCALHWLMPAAEPLCTRQFPKRSTRPTIDFDLSSRLLAHCKRVN